MSDDTSTSPRTPVIGYVRFSPRPSERALTIDVQKKKIRAYAQLYDLELIGIHEDWQSTAKTLARDGLQAALADLREGRAEGILISKLDRLTRSIKDMATLIEDYFEKRFSLFSVGEQVNTQTAGGRLVLNILMSVAQWEREAISERTKAVLQDLKEQGVRLGRAPLGYERTGERGADGRLEFREIAGELDTAYRILELRAEGKSLREIAEAMSAEGRETKRGGKWHPATVQRVLARFEETTDAQD